MSSITRMISGRKLFILTTIAVVVTGLTLVATLDDVRAHGKNGEFKFKCTQSNGSFFRPEVTAGLFFSSDHANCSNLGPTSLASVTTFAGLGTPPNCITLTTVIGPDLRPTAYGISNKGFIIFSMALEQCFWDSNGVATTTPAPGFCGVATDAFTSTVTGAYAITDGRIEMREIIGGSGTVSSAVDHCAGARAPYGNSAITTLTGDIVFEPLE